MFKLFFIFLLSFGINAFACSNHNTSTNINEKKIQINVKNLFLDEGTLFLQTPYNGTIPLQSVFYSNGACYTSTASFTSENFEQAYQCANCKLVVWDKIPDECPRCHSHEWIML